jgi:hypothetical protein
LTLILVRISPIACRPSTNLPSLVCTTHHSQQWVTPELGLNSTRVKGFLTMLMYLGQQERLCHRCQLKLIAYSPSFPTCLSHPGSVPLLCSTVLQLPHFLSGLQQQARRQVSEPCSYSLAPSRINSQQFSHLERFSHGPDNPPL